MLVNENVMKKWSPVFKSDHLSKYSHDHDDIVAFFLEAQQKYYLKNKNAQYKESWLNYSIAIAAEIIYEI